MELLANVGVIKLYFTNMFWKGAIWWNTRKRRTIIKEKRMSTILIDSD